MAEEAIEDLADLFRASLSEPTELYKIAEEWRLCQHYLRIESHRLGDRLQLEWDIESLPKDALVPPLSLQPLIENAIYHGIERLTEGGTIKIHGALNGRQLSIKFTNPIPSHDIEDTHKGNRLAQDNIRQRFNAVFNEKSHLLISNKNNIYSVELQFPYQTS